MRARVSGIEPPVAMPLCQIALSVCDLDRTHAWYREVLGMLGAGDQRRRGGPDFARVSGLPDVDFSVWCLVDQQAWFQFEVLHFHRPPMRPQRPDWRASDIGYSMIGFHTVDLDATIARLGAAGVPSMSAPIGRAGDRRVFVRDPEGVLLELRERDIRHPGSTPRPRPEVPVATRSITLSVPDLSRARRFWVDALGLEVADIALHDDRDLSAWGLDGARPESLVLWAGDFVIELMQYRDPPARPWPPDYRLSDQGIFNVGLGSTDKAAFDAVHARVVAAGYRGLSDPFTVPGIATVVYLTDDQGFSVELLHVEPIALGRMGFEP